MAGKGAKKAEGVTGKGLTKEMVTEVKEMLADIKSQKFSSEEELSVLSKMYEPLDKRMSFLEDKIQPVKGKVVKNVAKAAVKKPVKAVEKAPVVKKAVSKKKKVVKK